MYDVRLDILQNNKVRVNTQEKAHTGNATQTRPDVIKDGFSGLDLISTKGGQSQKVTCMLN